MKPTLPCLLPLLAVAVAHAGEKTDLATASAYRPQYDFAPPLVITPQTEFGQPLENQYDYRRPWTNPSAAQNVSTNTTRPLQAEARVGSIGDHERVLYRQRGSNLYGAVQAYRLHLRDYKDGSGKRVHTGYTRDGEMAMAALRRGLPQPGDIALAQLAGECARCAVADVVAVDFHHRQDE